MNGRRRFYLAVAVIFAVGVVQLLRAGVDKPPVTAAPATATTSPAAAATPPATAGPLEDTGTPPATGATGAATSTPARRPAPTYMPGTAVRWSDPRDVAARWVTAQCTFSWKQPNTAQLAAQTPYATPDFAEFLRRSLTAASWQANVVGPKRSSTCRVLTVVPITEAPNTRDAAYLRVATRETRTTGAHPGTPTGSDYPLRLVAAGGRWLVDGYSFGG